MESVSFVRRAAAIKTSDEFFAPLTFKIPFRGLPPFTSRCGGRTFLLIVATLLILERTAYQAILPSGFKIVQSTLLKIDGFKLNIDNVESLNKTSSFATEGRQPDITFYLDIEVDLSTATNVALYNCGSVNSYLVTKNIKLL